MKIAIEVDLEYCDPDAVVVGVFDSDGKYQEVKAKDIKNYINKTVSFDEAYMRRDVEDDSFYVAKLLGVRDEHGGKKQYPTHAKAMSAWEVLDDIKKKRGGT